jgi:hypothetical protein
MLSHRPERSRSFSEEGRGCRPKLNHEEKIILDITFVSVGFNIHIHEVGYDAE